MNGVGRAYGPKTLGAADRWVYLVLVFMPDGRRFYAHETYSSVGDARLSMNAYAAQQANAKVIYGPPWLSGTTYRGA